MLSPGFEPAMNEMAALFALACREGGVRCLAFSLRDDRMKGVRHPDAAHQSGALTIVYRDRLEAGDVIREARLRQFRPGIVWSGTDLFLRLAGDVASALEGRVLLHTEYFGNPEVGIRRRHWLGIPALRNAGARIYARRMAAKADLTVVSDPLFKPIPGIRADRIARLPWPSYAPEGAPEPAGSRAGSCFVGSLSRAKGVERLLQGYGRVLEAYPDFRVRLIGAPAGHREEGLVRSFVKRYQGRVDFSAPGARKEAIAALRKAGFIYCPVARLHWGLINDAWANGIPVLARETHYDLRDGENCMLVPDDVSLVRAAGMVRDGLYPGALVEGGMRTWREEHSFEAVLPHLMHIIERGAA